MVISITARERTEFNDLSILSIKHSRGSFESPNRVINRHDLNTKDQIGADIPLTRTSKSFIIQEIVNPDKLDLLLNKNGYLGQLLTREKILLRRVNNSQSLIFFYPSLTAEALRILTDSDNIQGYVRFFCATQMRLEAILLPTFGNLDEVTKFNSKKNLQLIPVLDIKGEMPNLSKEFQECRSAGSQDIPIIGFKFATYPNANKGYDMVMDNLDKIHENGQATMLVDASRSLQSPDCLNVSTPHYGAFIMEDIVAERYYGQIGRRVSKRDHVRLFCKNDLITPLIDDILKSKKFELDSELRVFYRDKKTPRIIKQNS